MIAHAPLAELDRSVLRQTSMTARTHMTRKSATIAMIRIRMITERRGSSAGGWRCLTL